MFASLQPFLTLPFFIELAVVLSVIRYVWRQSNLQIRALEALNVSLGAERSALDAAQKRARADRDAGFAPSERALSLQGALPPASLVGKRLLLIERNASRHPEPALGREFVRATDEARFWSGAFTFIGLCGTLFCLGIAVFYLMQTVGGSASGAGRAAGLSQVVSHMVAVFGGMGAAFLSTMVSVLFTVRLAGKTAQTERDWETLRADLDEFSLLELEPLGSELRQKDEELTRIGQLVRGMESVARGFNQSVSGVIGSLQSLSQDNATLAARLQSAAAAMQNAAGQFAGASNGLETQLDAFRSELGDHTRAQTQANAQTQKWLGQVGTSLEEAKGIFERLDALRADLIGENQSLRVEVREVVTQLSHYAQGVGQSNQSTFHELRGVIDKGLLHIAGAVKDGVSSERELLQQFGLVLNQMGDYASHVEDSIRQLPGAIGSEPVLLLQNDQNAALGSLALVLSEVKGELVGLRGDVRQSASASAHTAPPNGDGSSEAPWRGVEGQLSQVGARLQTLESVQSGVSGLAAQVSQMSAQVAQLRASSDKGFVLRIGGRGL